MLAAITSEMADIVRSRAWNASRRQSRKPFSLLRGTEGSNPSLSSRESCANLTSSNQGAARALARRQAAGRLIASSKMVVSLGWVRSRASVTLAPIGPRMPPMGL